MERGIEQWEQSKTATFSDQTTVQNGIINMYNIFIYNKAILQRYEKKSYNFDNCSVTETAQATVYIYFKSVFHNKCNLFECFL